MNWHKIKIDPADKVFSEFVRGRDLKCVCCGKSGEGDKGITGLQCSHFWGRKNESVRFEPDNADSLCPLCHSKWEHQKEIWIKGKLILGEYALFKLMQLGEKRYDSLKVHAHTFKKKDRKMSLIIVKELLKTL